MNEENNVTGSAEEQTAGASGAVNASDTANISDTSDAANTFDTSEVSEISDASERSLLRDAEALDDISGMIELGAENATFCRRGDYLALELDTATAERIARRRAANAMPGAEGSFTAEQLRGYARVSLRRAFPFDAPDSYISVFDADGDEIGMVVELSGIAPEQAALLRGELEAVYYMPHVRRILSIANKRGFQLWRLDTDAGETEITVLDANSNIIKTSGDGVIILDRNGNRYGIESISALDDASRRRIYQYM